MAAGVTQRATRSRERDHRLWERRIDAVEETYQAYKALASARRSAVSQRERPPDETSSWPLREEAKAAGVKLALYGALETSVAFEEAFNAWAKWYMEILGLDVYEGAQDRWPLVEEKAKKADAADQKLFEALHLEASLRPHRRWPWSRGRH
ncbi:hypothetical protein ACFY5F_26325 [Streptomyces sp. NPDC013161]|uniref:hypothetical protein n=1 Tax=Streptomyces sp. NPDC013161 TaxID=3364862 RepID=UPI0036B37871